MLIADEGHIFESTKTYPHSTGLSCTFRQWRANSHCNQLHGYALEFKFVFAATELDTRNWVVDFGSLKGLKGWLEEWFDHTLLVAEDDPQLEELQVLASDTPTLVNIRPVPATGCEATAYYVYQYTEQWLADNGYSPRVQLQSVEVSEHPGNSAIYRRI